MRTTTRRYLACCIHDTVKNAETRASSQLGWAWIDSEADQPEDPVEAVLI